MAKANVSSILTTDERIDTADRSVRVFEQRETPRTQDGKKAKQPTDMQVVRDHLTRIFKVSNNDNLILGKKLSLLNAMGQEYISGYPLKNNAQYQKFNFGITPYLAAVAQAQAHMLEQADKAKNGKDNSDRGKMGNQATAAEKRST